MYVWPDWIKQPCLWVSDRSDREACTGSVNALGEQVLALIVPAMFNTPSSYADFYLNRSLFSS